MRPPLLAIFLTATALAAGLAAQNGVTPTPESPAATRTIESPYARPQDPGSEAPSGIGDPALENLMQRWSGPPKARTFDGFPIFPRDLQGYGGYPRTLGEIYQNLTIGEQPLLPTAPAPPQTGWPRWLKNESREPLPYEPDRALLVQNVDRVWFKTVDDDAFVPLYFHDKLRAIRQGTAIEVRQVGEFELQFHGGSRIVAQGETALALTELTEAAVAIDVRALTHLRLEAFGREHRIALPDGSTLVVAPDARPKLDEAEAAPVAPPAGLEALAAVAGGVTPFQAALLVIERVDEPGWRAGRATVWNGGDLAVEWRHAFGTTTIAGGQRVTVLLTPPTAPIAGGFRSEGVDVRSEGPAVSCRADGDGLVSWSGARFRLQNGAVLRLDPLQGEPFAKAPEPTEQGR